MKKQRHSPKNRILQEKSSGKFRKNNMEINSRMERSNDRTNKLENRKNINNPMETTERK